MKFNMENNMNVEIERIKPEEVDNVLTGVMALEL